MMTYNRSMNALTCVALLLLLLSVSPAAAGTIALAATRLRRSGRTNGATIASRIGAV
jgi:P pilus assembly chaperone PapD